MEKIKLSLDIVNPSKSHNISIELRLNHQTFFDNVVSPGTHHVIYEFEEEEREHYLYVVMRGKTPSDTKIDDQGNIIEDAIIDIKNISVDEINIDQLMHEKGQYVHDGNGTEPTLSVHPFYGHLGCNGRVQLKFSCPIYIWLLENM